ncbi:glycosyltransferase [Pseudobutyrivibrio xylanivorans]|uniref:Glycosyl transferase family 2 n=1 Tax=Pseudobutyrivibrio xylanivorans TaxID=185007 RepID=A0A5P6VQD9_PSEXY|nr:glycosyltransferase [Pseudobutyrivibrio xylanivorans]QFJ53909.1 glycosyl transferase family 2 [Pseudobutyrivibrio xylanivorans]
MGNVMKQVSIIVPAYNVENFIDDCLGSILVQTYSNIEVIVVDDGSTDSTRAHIDAAMRRDKRVRGFYQSNLGVSAARNFGISKAFGTYIMFVDGDDYIAKDAVETMVAALEQTDADWVNCQYNRVDDKGQQLEAYDFIEGLHSTQTQEEKFNLIKGELIDYLIGYEVWNKIYKASIISENGICFNQDCHMGEDLAFNICYGYYANSINCIKPRPYFYRVRTDSAMGSLHSLRRNFEEHLQLVKGIQPQFEAVFTGKIREKFYQLFCKLMIHASFGYTIEEYARVAAAVNDDYFFNLLEVALSHKEAFKEFLEADKVNCYYQNGLFIQTNLKHAFLIMAHGEFESLKYLLQALDDIRNDIYLHIDRKTRFADFKEIRSWVKNAGLFFALRVDVRWGDISFVLAEMVLLKTATKHGHYKYYHLISGIDFPLKSQDEIHSYLAEKNQEFVSYHHDGEYGDDFMYKIKYYYPYARWVGRGYHDGPGKKKALLRWLTKRSWAYVDRQAARGVDRTKKYPELDFVKGDNWFSITDDLARYTLENELKIYRMYWFTNAPDEIFLQTLAINSRFKDKVPGNCLRYIDWNRGNPYEFVYTDLEDLIDSKTLFARKISYVNEPRLVRGLVASINGGSQGLSHEANNSQPLVSIIVPMYNVAEYLGKCLDSIMGQSYTKLQILLIDDGSTDRTATIAKQYARIDSRFTYIHQENKGLSGARNTGIENANGEYIAFVDSDDWIEPDYVSHMVQDALKTDADIIICGYVEEGGSCRQISLDKSNGFSRTSAMRILGNIFTEDYLAMIVAWNKLYKKQVFDKVRFAVGKIHEDEFAIHRIIDESKLICTVPEPLYHYRIRTDGITGSKHTDDIRHFDVFEAHQDRVECCKNQFYGEFYRLIVYSMFEELIQLMFRYSDEAYKKYHLDNRFRKLLLRECIRHYRQLDKHQKREYLMAIISPRGYVKRANGIMETKSE